jgi:hypothetical protein
LEILLLAKLVFNFLNVLLNIHPRINDAAIGQSENDIRFGQYSYFPGKLTNNTFTLSPFQHKLCSTSAGFSHF